MGQKFDEEYPLSNKQIDKWFDDFYYNPHVPYAGTFSRDALPKLPDSFAAIINLDGSAGPGTHWTAVYEDVRRPFCCFFCSYGLPPPREVVDVIKRKDKNRPIVYNTGQIQSNNSSLCGWLCIMMIKELGADRKYADVIGDFNPFPTESNVSLVSEYFE